MGVPDRRTDELAYERYKARSIARQPAVLLAVLLVLLLAVALTAAVDLRRLATPQGTTRAWVEAVVLGDCTAYARLSVPDGPPERRSPQDVCTALRQQTVTARTELARISVEVGAPVLSPRGGELVPVVVLRPEGLVIVPVFVVRRDGAWRVLRSAATCRTLNCP